MKKILLIATLAFSTLAALADEAPAFRSRSFLLNVPQATTNPCYVNFNTNFDYYASGASHLQTNLYYFNSTNILYQMPNWVMYASQTISNCIPTYPTGNTNPVLPPFGASSYATTNNLYFINGVYVGPASYVGYYWTNGTTNNFNTTYPSPFQDVYTTCDRNGDMPYLTLFASAACDLASSTNQLTFVFVRKPDGQNIDYGTNTWTVVLPVNGTTNNTYSWPVPSSFLQGAMKISLYSVQTAGTNVNTYLNGLSLNGPMP